MAIVTTFYYEHVYFGEPIAAEDFQRIETRAEQVINAVTRGQYPSLLAKLGNTEAATALTTAYTNAICAQMEYYVANGVLSVTTGSSGEGFTVGKVTVSGSGNNSSAYSRGALMLSPAATMYLEQTGLMGRVVSVPVEPYAPFPLEVF